MKKHYPQCTYRVSIKGTILFDNKLLMIRENARTNRWDLPGGGVEHNENLEDALKRELLEEVNIKIEPISVNSFDAWLAHDKDLGWERPILTLVVNVGKISMKVSNAILTPQGVEYSFFTVDEIQDLPLEKNIEPYRSNLLKKAFTNV